MQNRREEHVERIAIIDGRRIHFDTQSNDRDAYDEKYFHYIGKGKMCHIAGYEYSDAEIKELEEAHFFVRIARIQTLSGCGDTYTLREHRIPECFGKEDEEKRQKRLLNQARNKIGIGQPGFSHRR